MTESYIFKSPIGFLKITEKNGQLTELGLWQADTDMVLAQRNEPHSDLLYEACKQLNEYFAGK